MPVVELMAGALVNARLPVVPVTLTLKVNGVCPVSPPGPCEMPVAKPLTVCAPASSFAAAGLPAIVNDGGSFTAVTLTVKVRTMLFTPPLAVPPLSVIVTVIRAEPLALATGV